MLAELRDRIVWRHRSGEAYETISAALKVPKSTVNSVILKWKKFGTTRTLPGAGRPPKLSNRGRRALVREVTKNLMVTLTELQRSSQKDNHQCNTPWLYGTVARQKHLLSETLLGNQAPLLCHYGAFSVDVKSDWQQMT